MTVESEDLAAEEAGRSFAEHASAGYEPDESECFNAFLAHMLAAVANLLFLGMLVPVLAPLAVFLVSPGKRPFVLFHLCQTIAFQAALFAANVAVLAVISALAILTWGRAADLYVLACIIPLFGFVVGLRTGLAAKAGAWQRYPFVGKQILFRKRPFGLEHRVLEPLRVP